MGPRKATNKTAASTPSKKAAATKATKNTTSKARSSSKVPVENRSPDAEKSTSAEVKSPEVLKETNTVGEEEKEVLKDADEKPSVGEGLEDENVAEDSRAEISGGKVEDAAAVAEVKMEEQSAGDFEEKAAEKYQEEEKQSVENLDENVDQNADTKSAEDEDKEDAGNEAEVADANAVDEYSELQNSVLTSERRKSKKLEVFVGGLDKEATEDDLRQIFEKMGEITELRLMKDPQTGKNKGYAFVRYATPDEAKRAVQELAKVEIRGKKCGVSPLAEKDTVFIGNIDKNWTKDDVFNKLKELGVENVNDVSVVEDPSNAGVNRGFAFIELETHKDALIAFRTLQKNRTFKEDRTIKVAWAQPSNDPDEDVMAQVKSVFVNILPPTWNEEHVKEHFGKFGEIERVVLSCNMQSAKRKDFAFVNYTTREAAIACIEAFSKDDELIDGDSKVKVKVSLAKPAHKGKTRKVKSKGTNKGDLKGGNKGVSQGHVVAKYSSNTTAGAVALEKGGQPTLPSATLPSATLPSATLPSTTHEILHILRQQAALGQGHVSVSGGHVGGLQQAPMVQNLQSMASVQGYGHTLPGVKRPHTALGDISVNLRGNPRARLESTTAAGGLSYGLSAGGQGSFSNPIFAGASTEQFYHHPSIGGVPYATGSVSYAPIGFQGAYAHGGRGGGASSYGKR